MTVEIVQVEPPGGLIHEDEDVPFRIQVANDGPLDANQVSLLVEGLNGTQVKSNGVRRATWRPVHHLRRVLRQRACPLERPERPGTGGEPPGIPFHFKQGSDGPARDLVRVSVAGWSSSFDHMFNNHTGADAEAKDVYNAQVFENLLLRSRPRRHRPRAASSWTNVGHCERPCRGPGPRWGRSRLLA